MNTKNREQENNLSHNEENLQNKQKNVQDGSTIKMMAFVMIMMMLRT